LKWIPKTIEIFHTNEIPIKKLTLRPIEKFILRLAQNPIEINICENFEMLVRSFCFGLNTFSPFDINRQNGELESPSYIFSQMVK
jgi:hypothetical protein